MKKFILILSFLILYPYAATGYDENNLDAIEMAKYGRVYSNNDLGTRLRRLETDYFGMAQSGNIDKRISMLERFSLSDNSFPAAQLDNMIYQDNKPNAIKRFFNNVSSAFYSPGVVTGYTPPIGSSYYPNSIYRDEYMNFMNNHNNFCPYHNTYHPNMPSRYHNHYYNNSKYNSFRPFKGFNNGMSSLYAPYRHNPSYNPYLPTSMMTNAVTKSTVKILQD